MHEQSACKWSLRRYILHTVAFGNRAVRVGKSSTFRWLPSNYPRHNSRTSRSVGLGQNQLAAASKCGASTHYKFNARHDSLCWQAILMLKKCCVNIFMVGRTRPLSMLLNVFGRGTLTRLTARYSRSREFV